MNARILSILTALTLPQLACALDDALFLRCSLAGMPATDLPIPGTSVDLFLESPGLETPFHVRVEWQGHVLGYLPVRQSELPYELLLQGERVECRVHAHLRPGLPGQFMVVDLSLPFPEQPDYLASQSTGGDWMERD